jgi:general secretion pathway protein A
MKVDDVSQYIQHRVAVAGSRIPDIFSPAAIRKIYRFSRGIPRLINVACEQALVLAWTRDARSVSPSMATEIILELQQDHERVGFWHHISRWLFTGK